MTSAKTFQRLENLSPSDRAAVELKYDGEIPENFTVPNLATSEADIDVTNNGTTWSFHANSKDGLDALEALGTESWQWMGCRTLVVDHRPAEFLIEHLESEGITLL